MTIQYTCRQQHQNGTFRFFSESCYFCIIFATSFPKRILHYVQIVVMMEANYLHKRVIVKVGIDDSIHISVTLLANIVAISATLGFMLNPVVSN